jgi:hypothetical protein
MNKPKFEIIKTEVFAKPRQLKATWIIEDSTIVNKIKIHKNDQVPYSVVLLYAEYNPSQYTEIVNWSNSTFKYNTRYSKNTLKFKNEEDLNWFLLKWS